MQIEINLLPQKEKKRTPIWLFFLAAALCTLAAGFLFFCIYMKQNELELLEQRLAQTVELRTTLEGSAEQNEAASSVEHLNQAANWARQEQLPVTPILDHFIERLPDRGFFQSFSYLSDESLTLLVQFDTSREAAYYLAELHESQWVSSARLRTVETSLEEAEAKTQEAVEAKNALPRYLAEYEIIMDRSSVESALKESERP
ncbi:hypothetical protein [Domibacillus iocasae]|uniref:Fimbrial assembly protein n=1 Tax=Domibacillus iocasae TaxID=1714016 RepID=A0A1E7DME5_9BACI|nr:hypothetical protein [Domibacillus iocasae]OES44233.1 hypothetical protein BA724_08050 [Domibacillus iocasae]